MTYTKFFSRPLATLTAVFVMLFATGCFDIVEEYHVNRDGSGHAIYTVDLSEMGELMASFGGGDDESADSLKEAFELTDEMEALRNIPGISNVKNESDPDSWVLSYSYDFESIEALNRVAEQEHGGGNMMDAMMMGEQGSESPVVSYMIKGTKFTTTHEGSKYEPDAENAEMAQMMKGMFESHSYRKVFVFEQTVKKVKGENATLGGDGHTVTCSQSLTELLDEGANLTATIKLKK